MISNLLRYGTILLALLGVVGIVSVSRIQAERAMPPPGDPPVPPAPKPYVHSVSATGIIEALSENVAIGVPVSGLVKEVNVKVNQAIKRGDVLFRLDDADLRAQEVSVVAQQRVAAASVKVAEAELAKLKSQLARIESVNDPRAVSQDDLDRRRQDVAVAEARLASANAESSAADSERTRLGILIDRLTVRSPRDGEVIQVNIRDGEYASNVPRSPAMIVGDLSRLQVRADVDEQNATRIRAGQNGTASLKGDPNVSFPLQFLRVEPYVIPKVSLTGASTERVDTRVLQVIFSFDKPADPPVYVGQQVDVYIEAPER
jgi:RND family efflux transporter MFP subunit